MDRTNIKQVYNGQSGGYGYNRHLGTTYWNSPNFSTPILLKKRMLDFPSTSTTFVFSDSALLSSFPSWHAEESYGLGAPFAVTPFTASGPTTQFRHTGVANVAFLDGHVETREAATVASPATASWPQAALDLQASLKIGYLADNNVPYVGQ